MIAKYNALSYALHMKGTYYWIPENVRKEITIESGGKCFWCKKKAVKAEINKRGRPVLYDEAGRIFHIDHVIPLSEDGKNIKENMVLSCHNCNLSERKKKSANDSEITSFINKINGE